eukprot:COSAG05_NODE_26037_length_191_cov_52.434783_1_plen_47_part_01
METPFAAAAAVTSLTAELANEDFYQLPARVQELDILERRVVARFPSR